MQKGKGGCKVNCTKCKREFFKPLYSEKIEDQFGYLIQTNGFNRELLEKGLTYKERKHKYRYVMRDYCGFCGKLVKK